MPREGAQDVQVHVLGPVEITIGRRSVHLSRLQRHVIASLSVDPGRVLSVEVLADSLWGEGQPSNARNRIQALVSSLRRQLGEGAVLTKPPGYLLNLDLLTVDSVQFEREFQRGRKNNDTVALREALDRWRGRAFDGLHDARLDSAANRLHELRMEATETLIERRLATGEYADVVAEVTGLVAAEPFRERLRGQLMTALYGCGRTSDALAVYREGYELLATELGVDPGPALQQLHQAILGGDLGLLQPPPRRQAPAVNQLPPATPTFVGRAEELAEIVDLLTSGEGEGGYGPAVIAISGMGGLGKTSLALRAARTSLAVYPDGCLFVNLRGVDADPADPHAVLGGFIRALGVDGLNVPQDRDERLGLFRSITAERRLLLVLDNANGEAQVRPLLPGGDRCGVIITSRRTLSSLDGCTFIQPGMFTDAESAALLQAVVGPERLKAEPDAFEALVRLCSGMPLAVRVVAARLTGRRDLTAGQLVRRLEDRHSLVDQLSEGDLGVGASLSLSYRQLDRPAMALLPLLGLAGQRDFTTWSCAVLADQPMTTAAAAVREMAEAHLIDEVGGDRYGLHDLVRVFSATIDREPSAEVSSHRRLVEAYLDTCYSAANLLTSGMSGKRFKIDISSSHSLSFPDPDTTTAWLDAECGNVVSAVRLAATRGWHTEAWQLAYAMRTYFRMRHRMDEWFDTHSVALLSAKVLHDKAAEATIRESLGGAYQVQNKPAEALSEYQAAVDLYEEVGDPRGIAATADVLGVVHQILGNLDLAEKSHRRALAVPEYANDGLQAGYTHIHLGTLLGRQERYDAATGEFLRSLAIATQFEAWELVCFAHHNLAYAYNLLRQPAEAQRHAREEIELARQRGFSMREARGWELLGDCLADHDHHAAARAWHTAIELYEGLRDARAEGLRKRIG